jgi:hypothetical protein
MPTKKDHEFKENLDRCCSIVQQSSTKGISAVEVAEKMGKHRTTVHGYLSSLELMGRVESQHGIWYAKTEEQTASPVEKEIVIELPLPKNQWQEIARLAALTKHLDEMGLSGIADANRIFLEKFNETRTIRIKGKNVDGLDLEKLGNLIQQANKKSSNFDLKGLFKSLKKSLPSRKENARAHSVEKREIG